MDLNVIVVAALGAISCGALAYGLLYTRITAEAARERRIGTIRTTRARDAKARTKTVDKKTRIQSTIQDIEKQQKSAGKMTHERKLQQAGLAWTPAIYLVVCAVCGAMSFAVLLAGGAGLMIGLAGGAAGAFFLPRFWIERKRKKRMAAFLNELPNAVDVIVRGVKAGLPLNDCVQIVARESGEPVRGEFARVVQAQSAGISIPAALERMYYRMPLPETNFLAIVIAIQAQAGGSMSEALSNLSGVLRDRKKMKGKIEAMSMEAKASAAVIGSLPVAVAGLVYITSPDYISTLFTEPLGNMFLAGAFIWMLIGSLVMRKMIDFDF